MIEFLFCPQHGVVWNVVLPFALPAWYWMKSRCKRGPRHHPVIPDTVISDSEWVEIMEQMEMMDLETRTGG